MIFSKQKQIENRKFSYDPRHVKETKKERIISFREEGAFLARKEQVAGSLRDLRYAKRVPDRKANKFTKFMLILAIMGVIYVIYSDSITVSDTFGGEMAKALGGFAFLFFFLFLFIKKSNSSL